MSDENPDAYRRFSKLLHQAYCDFLEYELRTNAPDLGPAVRAGQLNAYIDRYYPILRKDVTPDICEAYMERFKYLVAPLDEEPEERLTPEKRYAKTLAAYREFREEVGFKGSREAEIVAFHHYIQTKYPHTLPCFTEEEAQQGIAGQSNWRSNITKGLLGTICAMTLALGFVPALLPDKDAPPPPRRNDNDNYLYKPRYDPTPYQPPIMRDPSQPLVPDMYNNPYFRPMDIPPTGSQFDPNQPPASWQQRYQRSDDSKQGPDTQPKR